MRRALGPLLLGLLILAAAVPFVLPLRDGRPLLDYRRIDWPHLPDIPGPVLGGDAAPAAAVTVYKWRGDDGEWQFGGSPPAAGVPFETVSVDPEANRVEGIRSAPAEPVMAPAAAPTGAAGAYSPARIQRTLDEAREVQSLLNQRAQQQAEVLRAR
jgi:hypothetical protein